MSCPYCYDKRARSGKEMSPQVIDACVNFYARTANGEPVSIMLLGGEPSLSPGVLRRIMGKCPEDYHFEVMTNAYSWSSEFLDALRPYRERTKIIASYDGLFQERRKPGSAEKVRRNILNMLDSGYDVMPCWTITDKTSSALVENTWNIICTFSSGRSFFVKRNCWHNVWGVNASYLDGLEKSLNAFTDLIAHAHVAKGILIQTLNHINQGKEIQCAPRKGTFSCHTGYPSNIVIDMDGSIYPCELYVSTHQHKMGDVWNGINMHDLEEMSSGKYEGAHMHNNICPYWNEIHNHDFRKTYGCINERADALLWEARYKVQDHMERLTRLKSAYGGTHVPSHIL